MTQETIHGYKHILSRATGEAGTVDVPIDICTEWDDLKEERCTRLCTRNEAFMLGSYARKQLIKLLMELS